MIEYIDKDVEKNWRCPEHVGSKMRRSRGP